MSEDGRFKGRAEHEWRPERTAEYAAGPVLAQRQAETIAALDATNSRKSTAALLGITSSTVDDHRRDGQARAVAAIRQLRHLLTESDTIREAVKNELGWVGPPFTESARSSGATFPNMSTEDLLEGIQVDPRLLDTPIMEQNLDSITQPPQHRRGDYLSWVLRFLLEHRDAREVEVLTAPQEGDVDDIDDLDVVISVSLDEIEKDWERHDVAGLMAERIAELEPESPLAIRRVE